MTHSNKSLISDEMKSIIRHKHEKQFKYQVTKYQVTKYQVTKYQVTKYKGPRTK